MSLVTSRIHQTRSFMIQNWMQNAFQIPIEFLNLNQGNKQNTILTIIWNTIRFIIVFKAFLFNTFILI